MAPKNMPVPARRGNAGRIRLITHMLDGEVIGVRQKDGYVDATAMCRAAGKAFSGYRRLESTNGFLAELSAVLRIHTTELIQSVAGGTPELQGTWVHPRVAVHLAQWLSPEFAVAVSGWIIDWFSGKRVSYHLRRYVANQPNVPEGHFSVLTEMIIALIAPLDIAGYELPESMWPDISEGKLFARYLRENRGFDTDNVPTYWHVFEDGRPSVRAKAYPNDLLALFRGHFTAVWLRQRARGYFLERDPSALRYVEAALPAAREPGMLPFQYPTLPSRH